MLITVFVVLLFFELEGEFVAAERER
jgi:hypothetical protein